MKLVGWLIAYWGIWVILGNFVLMVRFKSWAEEWQQAREESLTGRLQLVWAYLCTVTFWPREYRDQEAMERFNDEDDDDDDDFNTPGWQG